MLQYLLFDHQPAYLSKSRPVRHFIGNLFRSALNIAIVTLLTFAVTGAVGCALHLTLFK